MNDVVNIFLFFKYSNTYLHIKERRTFMKKYDFCCFYCFAQFSVGYGDVKKIFFGEKGVYPLTFAYKCPQKFGVFTAILWTI